MIRSLLVINLVWFFTIPVSFAKEYLVRSVEEFRSVASGLSPGDEVLIADGVYQNWALALRTEGSEQKPITIRAANKGKVVFTGTVSKPVFQIQGKYVILKDLVFKNCLLTKSDGSSGRLVEFVNSSSNRLSNCTFIENKALEQFMPLVIISGKGLSNRVDHCEFLGNIDCQDLQVKVSNELCPQLTLIDNNLFKDKPKVSWKVQNGGECVQIGQDPVLLGKVITSARVERNTFINCNAEAEVISNKSSGNSYIANVFQGCDGELVMRGGHDCIIDGNVISGGKSGIRINGSGHVIENNKIDSVITAIRLMYGMSKGKEETGFYVAASNCIIRGNTILSAKTGILVGDSKNMDWTGKFNTTKYPSRVLQDVAPFENDIHSNTFKDVVTTLKTN